MIEQETKFIEGLRKLLAAERYPEALERLRDGAAFATCLSPDTPIYKQFLLISVKIHIKNHNLSDAWGCLGRLEERYADINQEFEYCSGVIEAHLLNRDYDECSIFISECMTKNWRKEEYASLLYYTGLTKFWRGEHFSAERLFSECRKKADDIGAVHLTGYALYMSGYIAYQRCFFEVAEIKYREALKYFTESGKQVSQAHSYKMLAILAARIGDYGKVEEFLLPAQELFEKAGNRRNVINSDILLGRVKIFRGLYTEAERLLGTCYRRSSSEEFKRETGLSAEFLGEVYYHQGQHQKALEWLKKAHDIAEKIAPEGDLAVEIYRRLGDVYTALGDLEKAETALAAAHRLCEKLNDRYELGSVLRAYAMIAAGTNDLDLVRTFFNEAIITLKVIHESFELARTYKAAAETYQRFIKSGGTSVEKETLLISEAMEHIREAMHLFSSLGLDDRAKECRLIFNDIQNVYSPGDESECEHIVHRDEWVHEGILVFRSRQMLNVFDKVRHLAPSRIPVMIFGETGTGKEVVAKLIHRMSDRRDGPFIAVNCAAVPSTIFESEFFGHKKGSFTGALRDKSGLIEKASGGTLFLDDFSELGVNQQAKLLRAFQENSIRKVGETEERSVDVRVVSSSNEDIDLMLSSGKLRKDFYYRIGAEVIEIAPLRERKDDIEALFAWYMDGRDLNILVEKGFIGVIEKYHWPGNVRELVNVVNSMSLLLNDGKALRISDLPVRIRKFEQTETVVRIVNDNDITKLHDINYEDNRLEEHILSSLRKHRGNRSAVARNLGFSRSTLYRRMKELGIS